MTRKYAFVQLWPCDLKPYLLKMNIQFPWIFVIVKHVLRNNHYRNTVLVFTPEITATLKVISATTRVTLPLTNWYQPLTKLSKPLQSDLGHCRSDRINFTSYLSHYKSYLGH